MSHHPTATHHPPVVHGTNNNTLQAHHTISDNRHFALSYCLPVSFCLVTRGTHPLIILDPPASSCPLTKFQKGASHRPKFNQICTHSQLNAGPMYKVDALLNPTASCIISHLPFQRINSTQVCILCHQPVAQCIRLGVMQWGSALKQGAELHQAVRRSWKGSLLVSVHAAIMSASPYLHSIALSIQAMA